MSPLDASVVNAREGGPSFPLRHRLSRLVWTLVWSALARWTPTPLFGWRRFILRLFGAQIASTAKVYPGVNVWYPPNLTMHEHACLAPGVNCYCMDRIELGPYSLVSQGAYLCGGTHDVDDPNFQLQTKPIYLGPNSWVAAEAFVGPGVNVGEGAVLGARSVAFKDLQPFTIYVGNPAKALRTRKIREHQNA